MILYNGKAKDYTFQILLLAALQQTRPITPDDIKIIDKN